MLVEHKMGLVDEIRDRMVALDYGQKIAEGVDRTVVNDPTVIEAYLGKKAEDDDPDSLSENGVRDGKGA